MDGWLVVFVVVVLKTKLGKQKQNKNVCKKRENKSSTQLREHVRVDGVNRWMVCSFCGSGVERKKEKNKEEKRKEKREQNKNGRKKKRKTKQNKNRRKKKRKNKQQQQQNVCRNHEDTYSTQLREHVSRRREQMDGWLFSW